MIVLVYILAVYGVVYIFNTGGPFDLDIKGKLIDALFNRTPFYSGVWLIRMINCPFCLSFWLGIILSLIMSETLLHSIIIGFACYGFSVFGKDSLE
jgi:hypothetical protein